MSKSAGTSTEGAESNSLSKKDTNHFTMTMQEYEENLNRIGSQKGVRGVAVVSRDGEHVYYNSRLQPKMIAAYAKACLDSEYLCTVAARQNDPSTHLYYIRVETPAYEMVISLEKSHIALMMCDPPESYNGENIGDADEGNEDF